MRKLIYRMADDVHLGVLKINRSNTYTVVVQTIILDFTTSAAADYLCIWESA
jgi:hypothetical protein